MVFILPERPEKKSKVQEIFEGIPAATSGISGLVQSLANNKQQKAMHEELMQALQGEDAGGSPMDVVAALSRPGVDPALRRDVLGFISNERQSKARGEEAQRKAEMDTPEAKADAAMREMGAKATPILEGVADVLSQGYGGPISGWWPSVFSKEEEQEKRAFMNTAQASMLGMLTSREGKGPLQMGRMKDAIDRLFNPHQTLAQRMGAFNALVDMTGADPSLKKRAKYRGGGGGVAKGESVSAPSMVTMELPDGSTVEVTEAEAEEAEALGAKRK